MVSSCHYLATFAGTRMFERGGNAIDAGVAAGIALNVSGRRPPEFSGVAQSIVFRPGKDGPETIDGLGHWPASLDLDSYRATHGDDMPIGVARSVTPAAADAWLTALARHGRLSLAEILAPSIELCDGFPVYPRLAAAIERLADRLREWPTSAAVFLPNGRPPRVGEILRQPELGALFRRLAAIERAHESVGRANAIMAARDSIYRGDIAQQIAAFMRAVGGAITEERRASIRDDRAHPELPAPGDPWRYEGRTGPAGYRPRVAVGVGAPDTSFACAMDAEGNAFAATPSDPGLGAPLVRGLGMIVSTRGAQLWTTPGHPSAIAPGKRPRLTPNPALLMKAGRALMPFGCPGEDAQCQAMVQVVCNIVDFGMNTQAAIEAPRVISRSC